jgi:hypothetical protein
MCPCEEEEEEEAEEEEEEERIAAHLIIRFDKLSN